MQHLLLWLNLIVVAVDRVKKEPVCDRQHFVQNQCACEYLSFFGDVDDEELINGDDAWIGYDDG